MAAQSLEEKIQQLEKINEAQSQRIERLEDAHKIANMVNRYEYLVHSSQFDDVVELFAKKTPGVTVELGSWGVYEGFEGVKKLYIGLHKAMQLDETGKPRVGGMVMELNTTPVIEVAEDGKTAKGTWICPGLGTGAGPDGTLHPTWEWVKRAYDFVKEDGEWKFWHYHVYGLMMCSFYKSWAEAQPCFADELPSKLPPEFKADKPTTYHWQYNPEARMEFQPVPPTPYKTFDPKSAY